MSDMNPYAGTPLGPAFNPSFDPTSRFRPIPVGRYVCLVKMADPDVTTRWTKKETDEGASYWAKTIVEIIDGPSSGRTAYGLVSTKIGKSGASGAQELIIAAGLSHRLAECGTHEDITALVDEATAGDGATVSVYIDWEASPKMLDGTYDHSQKIQGSKYFPTDPETGEPLSRWELKDDNDEVIGVYSTQAVAKYYSAA